MQNVQSLPVVPSRTSDQHVRNFMPLHGLAEKVRKALDGERVTVEVAQETDAGRSLGLGLRATETIEVGSVVTYYAGFYLKKGESQILRGADCTHTKHIFDLSDDSAPVIFCDGEILSAFFSSLLGTQDPVETCLIVLAGALINSSEGDASKENVRLCPDKTEIIMFENGGLKYGAVRMVATKQIEVGQWIRWNYALSSTRERQPMDYFVPVLVKVFSRSPRRIALIRGEPEPDAKRACADEQRAGKVSGALEEAL